MRISRSLMATIVLPGALAAAQSRMLAPTPLAPTTAAPAANPLVEDVRTASDPSATIAAYTRGVAGAPGAAVELQQAYVRHMLELGAPEMADAQAHELVNRGATDATDRGVAAYNDARRGNAHATIDNLKVGLAIRPDDPFLLRTAGQVVAWYDARAERSTLSKDDAAGVEWLRAIGNGRQPFDDAHRSATAAWQPPPATAAPAGSSSAAPASSFAPTAQPTAAPAPAPTTRYSASDAASITPSANTTNNYYSYPSSGYSSSESSSYPYSSYDYYNRYRYGYGYGTGYGIIVAGYGDPYRARSQSDSASSYGSAGGWVDRAAAGGNRGLESLIPQAAGDTRGNRPLPTDRTNGGPFAGNAGNFRPSQNGSPVPPGSGGQPPQPPNQPPGGGQPPQPPGAAPSGGPRQPPSPAQAPPRPPQAPPRVPQAPPRAPGPPPSFPRPPGPPPGPPHP